MERDSSRVEDSSHTIACAPMRKLLAAFLALVYVAGCVRLNQAVANACTHGNCIHGWYSKYNGTEKALFFAWMIGFPLAVAGIRAAIRQINGEAARDTERQRLARATYDEASRKRQTLNFLISTTQSAVSRKPWTCSQCGHAFPAGVRYHYQTLWEGSYQTRTKYCAPCRDRTASGGTHPNPR